ncbi:MAG: LPD7 domain-containing protein, partial [Burkholderiales bacterium]
MAKEAIQDNGAGVFNIGGQWATAIRYEVRPGAGEVFSAADIQRMMRPDLLDFKEETGELYRWYEKGGNPRPRPLDVDELIEYLQGIGFDAKSARESALEDSGAKPGDQELWGRMQAGNGTETRVDLKFMNAQRVIFSKKNLSLEDAGNLVGSENLGRIENAVEASKSGDAVKGKLFGQTLSMIQTEEVSNLWDLMVKQWKTMSVEERDSLEEANQQQKQERTFGRYVAALMAMAQHARDADAARAEGVSDKAVAGDRGVRENFEALRQMQAKGELEFLSGEDMKLLEGLTISGIGQAAEPRGALSVLEAHAKERMINPEINNAIIRGINHTDEQVVSQALGHIETYEYQTISGTEKEYRYVGTAVLKDGTVHKFEFDVDKGADEVEIEEAARKALTKSVEPEEELEEAAEEQKVRDRMTLIQNEAVLLHEGENHADHKGLKAEGEEEDLANAVPDKIRKRFVFVDGKYYFPDEKPAFTDMTDKLRAHDSHHEVVNAMVEIAQARKWDSLTVRGTEEFRKAVWLKASAKGIEVAGYKPTEVDKALLAKEMEKSGKPHLTLVDPVNEIQKGIVAEIAVETAVRAESNVRALRQYSGELLEHGEANYNFDKDEGKNYFVKLRDDSGKEHVIWGVDLKQAMEKSGAQLGEKIDLQFMGKRPVEVMVNDRDASGKVIGTHMEV